MRINILGQTYKLRFEEQISKDMLELGQVDYLNQDIKIDVTVNKQLQAITLFHEIIHCILQAVGLDEENTSEGLISSLALGLYQTLNENKELLTFLCLGESASSN